MIDQILQFNKTFVLEKAYEKYLTDKYPDKKLAVLSCMDTRLTELLPAALGLKNGDAKIIKNAGGLVISPFDSAMRSLLVAVYELGVTEIMVVAHSHCGACHMSFKEFELHIVKRGIDP
ncbi:MAG: carbonic anhydrase, partial [Bacteroidales bacterium]|nr:carbonic anhydrase [Bacteroidales bacterium]